MKKTIMAGIGLGAAALMFAAKDPVIMTVNGVDVPKSEFEYLYHKNSQQQINPQNLDEYVEMFKLYKMKVADAKAEGIDTLSSFIKETEQYRHDLAAPYLADSVYLNKLVDEAMARSKDEVEANHIMLFKSRDLSENPAIRARMDSIYGVLKAGGDFEDLATRLSQDRNSAQRGGRMGYILANQYPYAFEVAAFSLPEGQFSEVVESPVGYHILKGGKHRPARGKVQAAHILKITKGKTDAEKAAAKQQIDSIYEVLKEFPFKFSELAARHSDDRGSARQGGMLPWFGAGEMVEPFESAAFSIADGEISLPFESDFGWHIVKRVGHKAAPGKDEMKPQLLARMTSRQDPRFKMIRDRQTATLAKKHNSRINKKSYDALRALVSGSGMDSTSFAWVRTAPFYNDELFRIGKVSVPVSEFVGTIDKINQKNPAQAIVLFDDNFDAFYNGRLVSAEEDALAVEVPEYKNLLKEYVDGSLLYEVSVRKVWDRAAKDTEGLKKYFEQHRDEYKWNEPHAKGYLVQAQNDSVASLIKARAAELGRDTLVNTIRKEFSRKVAIDKVLVAKGSNPMVDNIVFGGPKVTPKNANLEVYFMIDPKVITEPEEVGDVRGLVTSDYQNQFQEEWEKELRRKYPVKVYEKVLRKVK